MSSEPREYLVRKGGYYYRPNCSGYTTSKFEAGRYTKAEAEREAAVEPWHMSAIHQDDVEDDPVSSRVRMDRARIEALEAENARLKRERDDAKQALQNEIVAHGNTILGKAETAERLAGARVVTDEMVRAFIRRSSTAAGDTEACIRAGLEAALAEPAGEAEPCQFLPTEDGEFNGNTTETPIAAEDGREVDWIDVIGWGLYKGHAIPVDVARYIATKINLYAEHRTTPPDASAIRGALEAIRALSGLDGELCKASATIMSRMADIHQTADAALAGAKP